MSMRTNKEILAVVNQMVSDGQVSQDVAEKYFPELRESEADRKRRIICSLTYKIGQHLRDIFTEEEYQCFDAWSNAWLEKQSDQDPAWSEEVEAAISLLKHIAEEQEKDYCPHNANDLRKAAQYLETCRPQSTWKPSDEQMVVLNDIIINGHLSNANERILKGLQEQLKKLKE